MDLPNLLPGVRPPADQIAAHYTAAIQAGRLAPGDRLPPIRAVAAACAAPRAAVHDAYRALAARGLVESRVGRGTVVVGPPPAGPLGAGARALLAQSHRVATAGPATALPADVDLVADFGQFLPTPSPRAVADLQQSIERVLRARGGELLTYGEPSGDIELRSQLAERARDDGSPAPDDLLITNGAQQGIDIALRTLTTPGDAVILPVPTYHHLFTLLEANGLRALPVRWTGDGIDLDQLASAVRRPRARLLYVMPTFQNPTGRTLTAAQRRELVKVVARTRIAVLEDDCAGELRFCGEATPSLFALDRRNLTVTVRSFSKELFPGVRVGWLRASRELLPALAGMKRCADLDTAPLLQAALADFLRRGCLEPCLREVRDQLARRHAAAQRALAACAPPGSEWSEPEGGFALWVRFPAGVDDAALARRAASRGVLVTAGRTFYPTGDGDAAGAVRLSLSRSTVDQVTAGIEVLSDCVAPAAPAPLLL